MMITIIEPQVDLTYHQDSSWKKSLEMERSAMASTYRAIRAHNPAMARLLYQRSQAAEAKLIERIFGTGFGQ